MTIVLGSVFLGYVFCCQECHRSAFVELSACGWGSAFSDDFLYLLAALYVEGGFVAFWIFLLVLAVFLAVYPQAVEC